MECWQTVQRKPSGHPFGGNEDLSSNSDGADYGDESVDDDKKLEDDVVEYLKGEHGEVKSVHGTRDKPNPK